MSYRSAINNTFVIQTFSNNTQTTGTEQQNPASIGYVDASVGTINTNIASIEQTISLLTGQIDTINTSITTLQQEITTLSGEIVRPIGGIIMSPSSTIPPYTLRCNGQSLSTTDYPDLFSVIGYAYGGAGGAFNLPNFTNFFPLGGNGITDGVASSNLVSGNGLSGANNNQYITATSYSSGQTFPIMVVVPQHNHSITDPQHSHGIAVPVLTGSGIGETPYYTNGTGPETVDTQLASTGITVNTSGTSIQLTDPISNVNGVNITPPFLSVFFYITTN